MVIVDQDEGGGSGAEVGSVAAQPVLVNVRPPARLIERATAECAGRVELPSSITTNGAQVALADAQPADGGGDHELARAVVLRPAPGRAKPAPSSVTYVEQGAYSTAIEKHVGSKLTDADAAKLCGLLDRLGCACHESPAIPVATAKDAATR